MQLMTARVGIRSPGIEERFLLCGGCEPRFRHEPNVWTALDAALRVVAQVRELIAQFGQNVFPGVDYVDPYLVDGDVGKTLSRDAWQEIRKLACDLDFGVIAARNHEIQKALDLDRIHLDVRQLQHRDEVMACLQDVGELLQAKCVLAHAREKAEVFNRTDIEEEVVEADPEFLAVERTAVHDLFLVDVDLFDRPVPELRMAEDAAQGIEKAVREMLPAIISGTKPWKQL